MEPEKLTEEQTKELQEKLQEKTARAERAMAKIQSVLKEENCDFDVDFTISTSRSRAPRAVVKVRAL